MNRLLIVCSVCVFLLAGRIASAALSDFVPGTYRDADGGTLPYRLFVPHDYDPDRQYPLIVYLHGAGREGTHNLVAADIAPTRIVQWAKTEPYSAFVLVPQSPRRDWGSPDFLSSSPGLRRTLGLLHSLQGEYGIDDSRLYITGLSAGANGTWQAIAGQPHLFAAAVPVSGASTLGTFGEGRADLGVTRVRRYRHFA